MNFWLFVVVNKAVESCVSKITDGQQGNRDNSKVTMRNRWVILENKIEKFDSEIRFEILPSKCAQHDSLAGYKFPSLLQPSKKSQMKCSRLMIRPTHHKSIPIKHGNSPIQSQGDMRWSIAEWRWWKDALVQHEVKSRWKNATTARYVMEKMRGFDMCSRVVQKQKRKSKQKRESIKSCYDLQSETSKKKWCDLRTQLSDKVLNFHLDQADYNHRHWQFPFAILCQFLQTC